MSISSPCLCQPDSNLVISFDFNEQQLKENNDKLKIKAIGVTLTDDRFNNKKSAAYIHGGASSYIVLGTTEQLTSRKQTIAMWVNMQSVSYSGVGYTGNPFLIVRNGPTEDFNEAYHIGYNYVTKRFGASSNYDSTRFVGVSAVDTVRLNEWYHLVMTSDDHYFSFYVNGELQERMIKGFQTRFYSGDSVVLGRSTGLKNQRFAHAIFDDLRFYNRVLGEKEIKELFIEPNPNRVKNIVSEVTKYGIIVICLLIVIVAIILRNRKNLKKQREYYELNHKVKELELKVIKAQMNPHFISNCLAAIQNLIYGNQVDKAGQYLAKFSLFLRQILDFSDKTYISLEEELSIIELYVELEQLRFTNKFSFSIHLSKNVDPKQILIPSLITQTFVENAIWHGLLPLECRDPRLEINISKSARIFSIEITDNGVGRKGNTNGTAGKTSKGTRLASDKIESINKRRNSDDFKLDIIDLYGENNAPCGTKVIIQLTEDNEE